MGAFDIQGINCVFQLKIDDVYKTVVCAKSFTFNPVTDMKETTTVGSGFWKDFRPRKLSYTITFNGMLQVKSDVSQEKIKTFVDYQIQLLPLPYRLIYTDNSSNVMVVEGWVYVTSNLFDASPVNLVNGTVELQGSGMPTFSDVVPDFVNINIVSLGDPSIVAQIQFKLFDSTGAVVFDSGMLPGASGGNLTHPVSVTGQVQKGTYSIFWQADSQSIGNAFQLDAPPTRSASFNNTLTNESTYGVQDYDFTADRNVTFTMGVSAPPPTCVPPVINSSNTPDGIEGNFWTGAIALAGLSPFTISNVTKPSWMTILVGADVVQLSGPPLVGDNQTISFDINNACGMATFSTTIDIADNPNLTSIVVNFTANNNQCVLLVYRDAVLIHQMNTTDTYSFQAYPDAFVEVKIIGPALTVTKTLTAIQDGTGTIDSSVTTGTANVNFTVLNPSTTYTVNGEVH